MAYKGKYKPHRPEKYLGDPTKIIYRSLLERRFMVYCDNNPNVIEWSSEEVIVPYLSPIDKRVHRYFVDFFIRVKDKNNNIRGILIEVKPFSQTSPPKAEKKYTDKGRLSRRYLNELKTWGVNEAKWSAAKEYCKDRKWEFQILTEKELK